MQYKKGEQYIIKKHWNEHLIDDIIYLSEIYPPDKDYTEVYYKFKRRFSPGVYNILMISETELKDKYVILENYYAYTTIIESKYVI